jgi:hypothetical protein
LLARMLDAHPDINIAIDAFLPLYKSFRNSLCNLNDDPPLGDYLYKDSDILIKILSSDLNVKFNDDWPSLLQKLKARASDHSLDIARELYRLKGRTYKKLFDNALRLIAMVRGESKYVGMKDVWVLEFFPAIYRSFPNAKFILISRDPRASVTSSNAHPIDFARQWVKQTKLLSMNIPLIVTYSALVTHPRETLQDICTFLELPFHERMLEPSNYIDHNTGKTWQGNSLFDKGIAIDMHRINRWKKILDPTVRKVVEFICFQISPTSEVLEYYMQSTVPQSWGNLGTNLCQEFLNDWRRKYEPLQIEDEISKKRG